MLKAAIEKILSLDAPHIEEIEGRTYVDKDMTQIGKELRATSITMSNLSSLVDFIKKSKADFKTSHYIAQVVSPTEVRLFSSLECRPPERNTGSCQSRDPGVFIRPVHRKRRVCYRCAVQVLKRGC